MIKRFDFRRMLAIAQKETYHIRRDVVTLAASLGLPLVLVLFFGFAINLNVRNVSLLIADNDKTQSSRELTQMFSASGYFKVTHVLSTANAVEFLANEKGKAALIISAGFERDLRAGRAVKTQVLLDGADNAFAATVLSYLSEIQQFVGQRLIGEAPPAMQLRSRFLFNPEMDSHWFIVPGIFVIVVGLISSLLTALTVAREWENGSMELLLSTPVQPLEIIIGKIGPYMGLCLAGVALVYILARVVFGVPFVGSRVIFLFSTALFLSATMAQGLVISVVTRQQQLAFQAAMNTGMLPIQLLSGFIFPVESMPIFFRGLTMLLPARWYMVLVRSLFLRGADLSMLAGPLLALTSLTIIFVAIAWKKFKTDLEV